MKQAILTIRFLLIQCYSLVKIGFDVLKLLVPCVQIVYMLKLKCS